MDQVIKSAQDAAGMLERKLLQEFPSREAIEKYRGELVRLLCQGDKLKTLRHGTHSSVEWEQCAYLMREQVGAAGEWLRQKCQVSTEFSEGHSDSMSAVAGSFDGLSGAAESSENDCTPNNDILYKMEKKNSLKRRAAEELKTIPQIYHEEASSASADLETAGINVLKRRCTGNGRKNFRDFRQLACSWRFHPNEWYQQMFTIHIFIAGKLVPLVYCLTVQKDLPTYREIFDHLILKAAALGVVLQSQKVANVGMRTSYIHEAATKKKVKMLLETAFLPPHDVPVAVELLSRDATGSIGFNLEGWHFKMNRLAGKRHI
ncbi:hypothetical protein T05_14887, partial [Trichinella murrelli]